MTVAGGAVTGATQIPWLATLRGRVGYAFDRYLLYVTAGGAVTELNSTVNVGAISSSTTTHAEVRGRPAAASRLRSPKISAPGSNTFISTPQVKWRSRPARRSSRSLAVQDNLVRAGVNYSVAGGVVSN